MTKISEQFPGKWLKAVDLPQDGKVVKIKGFGIEKSQQGDTLNVLYIDGEKPLILNKTNAASLAKAHGDETDDWPGKLVTAYPTTCEVGGETYDVVRLRKPSDEIPF